MKKLFAIFLFLFSFSGCFFSMPYLSSEQSIQTSFKTIASYQEGQKLVNFLAKHPIQFEYADTAGMCHHFSLRNGKRRLIFVPEEFRASKKLLAMALYRAANIYRMYVQTGVEEIIAEEEEVAMLRQMHMGVLMDLTKEEFDLVPQATELKQEFCTYVLENSEEALAKTRYFVQTPMPACQRPLENIVKQEIWLKNMRHAISDDTFHHLMADRDKRRVAQGRITDSQAARTSANLLGMPNYEMTRYERTFFDDRNSNFTAFNQIYLKELYNDISFRRDHADRIYKIATDFAECDLESLMHQYDKAE